MNLFGGVIPVTGITFLVFCLFAIMAVGYSIGRIEIKGISLGTAGVFIVALLFGALFYDDLAVQLPEYTGSALKIVENIGLILFVTSVGFIAGPKFFGNMKKNFKSYVLLGLVIILAGGISAVACIYFGRAMGETDNAKFASMVAGLLSGALTSTPAFSAAKATVAAQYPSDLAAEYEAIVSVGNGISYIFGVVGVVLFVQLMPKILKADMEVERAKLTVASETGAKKKVYNGKLIEMDSYGIMPFALAAEGVLCYNIMLKQIWFIRRKHHGSKRSDF